MPKYKLKEIPLFRKISVLREFLKVMEAKPLYFVIQAISSISVAFFSGLSIGLLAPLTKGIVGRDFSFLKDAPVFKTIISQFPQVFDKAPETYLFFFLVAVIFIAALAKNILGYLFTLYLAYQKEKFSFNMKTFVFDRYLSFGKLYFDRTSQGHIRETLYFLQKVLNLLTQLGLTLVSICTLCVYLAIMVITSWKLTFYALSIVPPLFYLVQKIIAKIKKSAKAHTELSLKLGREVFNILTCISLVKAYSGEKEAKNKFNEINSELRKLNFDMSKKRSLVKPLHEIMVLAVLLILISLVGFKFTEVKADDISKYFLFLVLAKQGLPLFNAFSSFRTAVAMMEPPLKKVLEVLHNKGKFFVPEGNIEFRGLKKNIEFHHLSFSYHHKISILKDLSFNFEKGEMTAIVGPTGAGKTTIISLLMRFYDCPASAILIDGIDIRDFTLKSLRRHIALVTQDVLLFNDTLRRNITYGVKSKINEKHLVDALKKAHLHDFIKNLPEGLDTEIGDRGVKLSGGEKQRVSIARAIMKDSEIVILDEATSSLDSKTEKLIQEAIEQETRGRTTIAIAHRLSTIKNTDKIIVIENGKLIEQGSLEYLLKRKGKFYEYWEAQKFF